MKSVRLFNLSVFIGAILICGSMSLSFAQDRIVNANALIQETQKMILNPDQMTMVWWIPEEFWQVSFEQNPNIEKAEAELYMDYLRPYTLIVVAHGKIGSFGWIIYKTETFIRNNIRIIDSQGISYAPVDDEKIKYGAKYFLSMMKPVFEKMLGSMGPNMHFFLFPSKSKSGQSIAVAKDDGFFSVKLDEREYKWRLPLGALVPPKICPVDGEELSGGWKFCPWHGVDLK
jgi:hypothetical protein